MFFGRNNDIDDDYETKDKKTINLKLPLIILGSIILLIIIVFLVIKLFDKEEIVYEERLYFINLIGEKEITLYAGEEFVEPGYTATDDSGNDLTSEVVIDNNIDNNNVGNYKVSYTLGNITKERNVKVIEKPTGATYIYLYGDVNTFLYVGEEYQEKGYEVIDTIDGGKLKDKVKINSNVDTSKEGIYKVIYSVTNTSGVTVSKERIVIVTNRDISLLPNTNDITNSNVIINIYAKDELFDYLILPNNIKVTERISTYEVSSNGTYKFTMYNAQGDKIEKQITINNIDREAPSGSCSGNYGSGISQINIKASDNTGISKYVLNGVSYTTNSIRLNEELRNANIIVYDEAGNSKSISCKLEDKNPPASSNVKPSSSSIKPSSSSIKPSSSSRQVGTPLNIPSSLSDYNGYALYVPENATTNMPLIIYLLPNTNDYVYSNAKSFITKWPLEKIPAFVLIIRNSTQYNWIRKTADELIEKYSINKSKISTMGFSSSGTYVYYMVAYNQDLFSAMVVFSSGAECNAPLIQNNLKYFKTLPTKGFGEEKGRYDGNGKLCGSWTTWSPVSAMTSMFNCLGRMDDFTPVGKVCHDDIRDYVFHKDKNHDNKSDLLEWMISQTKQ